jgi:predicted O-linked N-acetylglucosamine transferase (SPINDLY family)
VVVSSLNHLGRVQEALKHFAPATHNLEQSLRLQPDQPDVLHHWVFLRQKQCAWPVYAEVPGVSVAAMREATSALAMLNISDDPQEQLDAALRFVQKKLRADLPRFSTPTRYGHQRIRIGYCSSDFSLHPVSMLTVQLFELHNRAEFEVFAYCWSPEDGSALRQRVIGAMDHFHRIDTLSDAAAAQLIRAHEIDILVDLQGQTAGARADLLGYRPAPIQITYLGLPATTGLPSIDYVIADEFLIPPQSARFYSEQPLYLPDVYQVSDRLRLAAVAPSRQECGLPDTGFVFCSFNNSYKYTPEVFAVWMQILQRVQGSVLWLLADNSVAEANLREQAQAHGVAAHRLVFAPRVSPENYLARYHRADLFLDTFPFNAGTTANDCLWMGCPLLTQSGRSFASRMAGALLTAAGLPELITYDLGSYAEQAVALAQDPARCLALRAKLAEVRSHGALFDTPKWVRALEQRLKGLVQALPATPIGA